MKLCLNEQRRSERRKGARREFFLRVPRGTRVGYLLDGELRDVFFHFKKDAQERQALTQFVFGDT